MRAALDGTAFTLPPARRHVLPAHGLQRHHEADDVTFAERLLTEAGVATIPLSPFYQGAAARSRVLRLCIAKRDETLDDAAARLQAFARG